MSATTAHSSLLLASWPVLQFCWTSLLSAVAGWPLCPSWPRIAAAPFAAAPAENVDEHDDKQPHDAQTAAAHGHPATAAQPTATATPHVLHAGGVQAGVVVVLHRGPLDVGRSA